jgi:hypothetical protein
VRARRARFCDYRSACSLLRRARWKLKSGLVTSLERSSMHTQRRGAQSVLMTSAGNYFSPPCFMRPVCRKANRLGMRIARGSLSFIEENGMNIFTAAHISPLKLADGERLSLQMRKYAKYAHCTVKIYD